MIDYKGKYFLLQDKVEEGEMSFMDIVIGKMTERGITDAFLQDHVRASMYYGIPAYIGSNKKLNKRIDKLYKQLEKE